MNTYVVNVYICVIISIKSEKMCFMDAMFFKDTLFDLINECDKYEIAEE